VCLLPVFTGIALALSLSGMACADSYPANYDISASKLRSFCGNTTSDALSMTMYCTGYVTAVAQMARSLERQSEDTDVCLPADVPQADLVHVVVSYLTAHKHMSDEPANLLVISAFANAYPCSEP
jgi:hypothetical protein